MEFTNYDRISDTLMYIDGNIYLEFAVSLSRKTKTGERSFFHNEFSLGASKINEELKSVKRNMNFYFILSIRNDFMNGFILRYPDIEYLSRLIDLKVIPWFLGTPEQSAFLEIKKDNENIDLALKDFTPVYYFQEAKSLSFSPCIMYDRFDRACRGIKVSISDIHSFELPVDKFMEFYCILTKTDMYAVASSMVTYVKCGPYNVNPNNYVSKGLGSPMVSSKIDDDWYNRDKKG